MQGGSKNLAQYLCSLTLSNINKFLKLFHCQNQKKIAIIPSLKIAPHLKCVATLPCEMSLSETNCCTLVSGVAGLNVSSSSNVDTLNIWCKNCRIWQLLQTITETLNTLSPVVNFLKCVATQVILFSICFSDTYISQGSVTTHLRCSGIFSDSIITNFLLILTLK